MTGSSFTNSRKLLAEAGAPFWSSRAIRAAFAASLVWCGYATVIFLLFPTGIETSPITDASLALIIGLLLAVRTNRSYERWWEGRILWGTLVNASRNLAVKMQVYAAPDAEEARRMHALIAAFAYGLRDQLRSTAHLGTLPGFAEANADPAHVPSYLVARLHEQLHAWEQAGRLSPDELRMLDLEARVLLEICGACERIRSTALPPALTWAARGAVTVALLAAPLFLEGELGWLVIPAAGIATFLLLVAGTIAHALEHPFGLELNQLNLSVISGVIDTTTAEILDVPPTDHS